MPRAKSGAAEQGGAVHRMRLHHEPLLVGERVRLVQEGIRDANLADVMHAGGRQDQITSGPCRSNARRMPALYAVTRREWPPV